MRETVEEFRGFRVPLGTGPLQPPDSMSQIRFSARAEREPLTELKLRLEVSHFGRLAKPDHGFDLVWEHAKTILILESELKLGRGHAAVGGLPEQLQGSVGGWRMQLTGFVQTRKTILSLGIAGLSMGLDTEVSDLFPFPRGPFGRLAQPLIAQSRYLLKHTMHTVSDLSEPL
jgi:hypothetical protein